MLLWGWLHVENGERTITDKLHGAPELENPTEALVKEIIEKKSICIPKVEAFTIQAYSKIVRIFEKSFP